MSSSYVIAAISISSILALFAIIMTSNNAMNNSLLAQDSIQIQTHKNQENLEIKISNDVLTIKNNGLSTVVIKEIRIYSDVNVTSLVTKKKFSNLGLQIQPLKELIYSPSEFSIASFSAKTVLGITDLGNVFTAMNIDDFLTRNTSNKVGGGQAMINGMGINSRIVTFEYLGKLIHGFGNSGTEDSLKIYNQFSNVHDFAAQLLSTDPRTTVAIPQFNTEYRYISTTESLQIESATNPNILGFSQARTVGGLATTTVGPNGITISGTGTVILKLNDFGGQTLILEGNVPNGGLLQLGTDLQYDYINMQYDDTYGFKLYTGGLPSASYSQNGCTYVSSAGYNCNASWTYTQSFSTPLIVSSPSNYYSYYYSTSWPFSILGGTQNSNTYSVNSIRMIASASSGWYSCNGCYPTTSPVPQGYAVFVFDKGYVINNKIDLSGTFQTPRTFQINKQHYIFAKPNGGTITIKGSSFNQATTPYLKINNLPPNIPYEVVKDGMLAVSGMANYDGTVSLLLNDVNIGGISPTATLYLYPNSMKYRGPFSTVIFDNVNGNTFHINTSEEKIYVVHAYVQIPVVGNVTVTDVYLDNALAVSYLDRNYTTGDHIRVPVIPGYYNINMKINGILTTTVIANVLGNSGLKVIQPSTSTITQYNENNIIPSIKATAGSVSYIVATASGIITTSITATISGESEIKNYAYFGAPPSPPPSPAPRDPLKAWVNVYKNGVLVNQKQIYFNANPISQNSGGVSGSSSYVADKYVYSQTVINGIITTNVLPGDFVEFYLYANVEAVGSTPPIPSGYVFYHYSGEGHGTATVHSGSILSS